MSQLYDMGFDDYDSEPSFAAPTARSGRLSQDDILKLAVVAGSEYGINPYILAGMARQESGGKIDAESRKGARGLMQIMPDTQTELGVTDPDDPVQSMMGGAKYLRKMLDRYDGNYETALAAYNAGPGNVDKAKGIPAFEETQKYIPAVLNNALSIKSQFGDIMEDYARKIANLSGEPAQDQADVYDPVAWGKKIKFPTPTQAPEKPSTWTDVKESVYANLGRAGNEGLTLAATLGGKGLELLSETGLVSPETVRNYHAGAEDVIAEVGRENKGAFGHQSKTFAGELFGGAAYMAPALVAGAAAPAAMLPALIAQAGWGAGTRALEEGYSEENAKAKVAVSALANSVVAGALSGKAALRIAERLPVVGKLFTPGAVDSAASAAKRAFQAGATNVPITQVEMAANKVADLATGEERAEKPWIDLSTAPLDFTLGALMAGAPSAAEYGRRNDAGGRIINADVPIIVHSNNTPFTSEKTAQAFLRQGDRLAGLADSGYVPIVKKMADGNGYGIRLEREAPAMLSEPTADGSDIAAAPDVDSAIAAHGEAVPNINPDAIQAEGNDALARFSRARDAGLGDLARTAEAVKAKQMADMWREQENAAQTRAVEEATAAAEEANTNKALAEPLETVRTQMAQRQVEAAAQAGNPLERAVRAGLPEDVGDLGAMADSGIPRELPRDSEDAPLPVQPELGTKTTSAPPPIKRTVIETTDKAWAETVNAVLNARDNRSQHVLTTDGGRFTVQRVDNGFTPQQMQAAIRAKFGPDVAAKIEVLPNSEAFAKATGTSIESARNAEAVVIKGDNTRYINAENIHTLDRALWVAAHEGGHLGVDGFAQSRLLAGGKANNTFTAEREKITRLAEASRTTASIADAMTKSAEEVGVRLSKAEALEEAIVELHAAHRTGNYRQIQSDWGVSVPKEMRAQSRGFIGRAFENLKAAYSKVVGRQLSDDELTGLIKTLHKYSEVATPAPQRRTAAARGGRQHHGRLDGEPPAYTAPTASQAPKREPVAVEQRAPNQYGAGRALAGPEATKQQDAPKVNVATRQLSGEVSPPDAAPLAPPAAGLEGRIIEGRTTPKQIGQKRALGSQKTIAGKPVETVSDKQLLLASKAGSSSVKEAATAEIARRTAPEQAPPPFPYRTKLRDDGLLLILTKDKSAAMEAMKAMGFTKGIAPHKEGLAVSKRQAGAVLDAIKATGAASAEIVRRKYGIAPDERTHSALQFLALHGGISKTDPLANDLRGALGVEGNPLVPGAGLARVFSNRGMPMDDAALLLVEHGYLREHDAIGMVDRFNGSGDWYSDHWTPKEPESLAMEPMVLRDAATIQDEHPALELHHSDFDDIGFSERPTAERQAIADRLAEYERSVGADRMSELSEQFYEEYGRGLEEQPQAEYDRAFADFAAAQTEIQNERGRGGDVSADTRQAAETTGRTLDLGNPTPEGLRGLARRIEEAEKAKKTEDARAAKTEKDARDQAAIAARQDASAENYELGQSAEDGVSGQSGFRFSRVKQDEADKSFRAPEVRDDQGRLLAPNGKPSKLGEGQWHQVRSPAFKNWFGDFEGDPANASKVVDENGEPAIVYHTTDTPWTVFDSEKARDSAVWGKGIYLSTSGKLWKEKNNSIVAPLFLRSTTPLDITKPQSQDSLRMLSAYAGRQVAAPPFIAMERRNGSVTAGAKAAGFDSIIHEGPGSSGTHVVAFDPTQIKSATGNRGAFDKNDPDIRHSLVKKEENPLRSDIPSERWLKEQVDYAKSKGRDRFGAPYMGKVTGRYAHPVDVPVSALVKLKGLRGEQNDVREADLAALKDVMRSTGKLPLVNGKEYAPFVMVAHNGEAWVSEGNHRIMAARDLGWETLPVEIRYYDGGERQPGPMSPGSVNPDIRRSLAKPAKNAIPLDRQPDSEQFKAWSDDAPIIRAADAKTHEFKTGAKVVVEAFHGAARPDRIGGYFDPKRATSGPMVFTTSDPAIASNYATGKADTSLYGAHPDYASWFKFKGPSDRSAQPIDKAWYRLTPEQRKTIAERMPDIRTDDDGNVIYEKGGGDPGSYAWELQQTQRGYERGGNPLKAAVETWLNSGHLFGDEEAFMRVLKLAGVPDKTVEFDSQNASYPAVYKLWVSMRSPLVTNDVPQSVRDALNAAAKTDRSRAKADGADEWDKARRTLRQWVADFNAESQPMVWTSIPDKVTDLLRSLGYDGIIDTGGKMGGAEHRVYVPFKNTQIKSATGNRGTYDLGEKNMSYSLARKRDVDRASDEYEYHRFANTGSSEAAGYSMFANDVDSVRHYGKRHYGLNSADVPQERVVYAGSKKFQDALIAALENKKVLLDEYQTTAAELSKEANPERIVDSAGIWDNLDMVALIRDEVLDPNRWVVVETKDGAIVFDDSLINEVENNSTYSLARKRDVDRAATRAGPAAASAMGKIGASPADSWSERTADQLRETKEWANTVKVGWQDKLIANVMDEFHALKQLGPEVYKQVRVSAPGQIGALDTMLHYGMVELHPDGVYQVKANADGLGFIGQMHKILKDPDEVHDFFAWQAGKRAEMLAAQKRENLFTLPEIQAMKRLNLGDLADGTSRAKAYDAMEKIYNEYQHSILDIAVKSGQLSASAAADWKQNPYVPFYRQMEEDGKVKGGSARQGLTGQDVIKKLKGGSEPLGNLMENTLRNWQALLDSSMRNLAANKAMDQAEKLGVAKLLMPRNGMYIEIKPGTDSTPLLGTDGKPIFHDAADAYTKRGGSKIYWSVTDKPILEALQGINYSAVTGNPAIDAALRGATAAKSIFSRAVMASPTTMIRNVFRDMVQSIAVSDLNVTDYAKGMSALREKSADYWNAKAAGATFSAGVLNDGGARAMKLIREAGKEPSVVSIDNLLKWHNAAAEAGESLAKVSLYQKKLDQAGNKLDAAYEARDLMDFNLRGKSAAIRTLGATVPFLNARIQGLYKLGRAGTDPATQGKMALSLLALASASVALYLLQKDEEWYKRLDEPTRNNYWPIGMGDRVALIPKPFELGALATVAERGAEFMFGGDDYKAKDYAGTVLHLLVETLAFNPIPQLVNPLAEIAMNKNQFTGQPIDKPQDAKVEPWRRFDAKTSTPAVWLSAAAHSVLSDTPLKGFRPSPNQIEHVVRGYFGWVGTQAITLADWVTRPLSDRVEPVRQTPEQFLLGGFEREKDGFGSKYITRLYDTQKTLNQIYQTAADMRRENDPALKEYRETHKVELRQAKMYDRDVKTEAQIRSRIRGIENSPDIPQETKRERIKALRKRMDEIAKRLDVRIREAA